jgi:hypothetical protein
MCCADLMIVTIVPCSAIVPYGATLMPSTFQIVHNAAIQKWIDSSKYSKDLPPNSHKIVTMTLKRMVSVQNNCIGSLSHAAML